MFYAEAHRAGSVWAVRDDAGLLVPEDPQGRRALPFWSSRGRLDEVLASVPAYRGCRPATVPLVDWRALWLPGMERDGLLVGLNWSGVAASGYAVTPADVETNLAVRDKRPPGRA